MTLVELLIVISIISILAGLALTRFDPALADQLRSVAQIAVSDLARARDLAVANSSTYRLTFDTRANRYALSHVGANRALDRLPPSPFSLIDEPPERQTTDLTRLPLMGGVVELVAVRAGSGVASAVSDVEFGPLGETTRSEETVAWFASGTGESRRYISVRVDPVTGLGSIGDVQVAAPPAAAP